MGRKIPFTDFNFLFLNFLPSFKQTQTIWSFTQTKHTDKYLHIHLWPCITSVLFPASLRHTPLNSASVVCPGAVARVNTHAGSSTGQNHFPFPLSGSPEVFTQQGHIVRWHWGYQEGEEGKRERVRKGKTEQSSRTGSFYFGPVVNWAWLSDRSSTQQPCVSTGGITEGETAIFRKGEHPPNSKGGGSQWRER